MLLKELKNKKERLEQVYAYTRALQDVNDLIDYLKDLKVRLDTVL